MDLKQLIMTNGEGWKSASFQIHGESRLTFPFELCPRDFLSFARRDMQSGGKHGGSNALTNAKRAVDCQVAAITKTLGIDTPEASILELMTLVHRLGLIGPALLHRIIRLYAFLDKQFKLPPEEQIQYSLDTATAFVEATNRVFSVMATEFSMQMPESALRFSLALETGQCTVSWPEQQFTQTIHADEPEYLFILSLSLKADTRFSSYYEEEVVEEFVAQLATSG